MTKEVALMKKIQSCRQDFLLEWSVQDFVHEAISVLRLGAIDQVELQVHT